MAVSSSVAVVDVLVVGLGVAVDVLVLDVDLDLGLRVVDEEGVVGLDLVNLDKGALLGLA